MPGTAGMCAERRRRLLRLAGAAGALAAAWALLRLAQPAAVSALMRGSHPRPLLLAAALYAAILLLRSVRLRLLLPAGTLGVARGAALMAAARAAAVLLPLRTGEIALPLLLRRLGGIELAGGVATLLALRALDLAALGAWGIAALLWVGGPSPWTAAVLPLALLPLAALPAGVWAAERLLVRAAARHGGAARAWVRRVRRLRRALETMGRRRRRAAAAAAISVALWGGVWALTGALLLAMDRRWPWAHVVAGSVAASLANMIPANAVANIGTLEAGWTGAFVALGVAPSEAAATGFATHLWAILFAVGYGAAGAAALALSRPRRDRAREAGPGAR